MFSLGYIDIDESERKANYSEHIRKVRPLRISRQSTRVIGFDIYYVVGKGGDETGSGKRWNLTSPWKSETRLQVVQNRRLVERVN